ncbi:YegP family protein, partial [Haemophilus influenzae]|uniref:YegP family protein n=1 Tax=Haemophilus influenzae TaxID=727 RepID=UPI0010A5B21B
MYFQIFKGVNNQWYWRLKAANHEIIAVSEGYTTKQNCLHCIHLVMDTNRNTPTVSYTH